MMTLDIRIYWTNLNYAMQEHTGPGPYKTNNVIDEQKGDKLKEYGPVEQAEAPQNWRPGQRRNHDQTDNWQSDPEWKRRGDDQWW